MEFLRASEVAEYVYCARAWWLRRQGIVPEGRAGGKLQARLARGRRSHAWHSFKLHSSAWLAAAALLLLAAAAAIALLTE
jgi:CRISPR/Cas system-associated exonuclease Cas4 (RecB family)